MTTLGSKARRLQAAVMQPLEQLRGDVLYHLTALELQRDPWMKQINDSLQHLKTIQYFIDHEVHDLCENRSKTYTNRFEFKKIYSIDVSSIFHSYRLKNHLVLNKQNTNQILVSNVATCGPIYNIFNAYRTLICHHLINPLNGLWFIAFLCLFLWLLATPFSLILASTYRRVKRLRKLRHTNSHQYG